MARTKTAAQPPARVRTSSAPSAVVSAPPEPLSARLFDAGLVAVFLALTFLLGAFPLNDTDFWWHLRTGDWIRQNGWVPSKDLYTFTASDHLWTDLHWGYQLLLSWGYQVGGVRFINLAKCAIISAAMLLFVTSRRRDWPVWVMLLVWLPALFLLSGRMYVRPETLTLLFLAASFAVYSRWEARPRLAYLLPAIELVWVNVQGLFVLGLVILGAAVVDAGLKSYWRGVPDRKWWKQVGPACALTVLACLFNPYGLLGALYPIELARTMSNPVFRRTIAELLPLRDFIEQGMGLTNPMLQVQLATFVLGVLSFLVPTLWTLVSFLTQRRVAEPAGPRVKKRARRRPSWAFWPSPFRLALFGAFCFLGWQALRNSNQFAAVVGAVTAWNFGEWASAVNRRRALIGRTRPGARVAGRVLALVCLVVAFAFVASGRFYAFTGEGRTFGLGEKPLWYPHEAVRLCGREGMPDHFLGFHIGHASLYDYYYGGPEKKVYADARLEVIGPDVYESYMNIQRRISADQPGWSNELRRLGPPVILVDNSPENARVIGGESFALLASRLMAHPDWRCVWYDPMASVFVHRDEEAIARDFTIDFAARHFRPDPSGRPEGLVAVRAMARVFWNHANVLQGVVGRPDLARPLVWLGLDNARRARAADPDDPEVWKVLALLERTRMTPPGPRAVPRFRMPLDLVVDLPWARLTFDLRQALDRAPDDPMALLLTADAFETRQMIEAALPPYERLGALRPTNKALDQSRREALSRAAAIRSRIKADPGPPARANASELERSLNDMLEHGRAASAADLIEREYPAESRSWAVADRLATLRLHLGEPSRARAAWMSVASAPRPALRDARVALTHLVEGDFDAARQSYGEALKAEPDLFEAHYGLASMELDLGRARASRDAARRAVDSARDDSSRGAAKEILTRVEPYADDRSPVRPPR